MKHWLRAPSPAVVISLLALFVALGGTTYAATSLPKNSVGTRQLRKSAVTSSKIKRGAVTAGKINARGLTVPKALFAKTAGGAPPSGSAGGGLSGTYPNPSLAAPEAWHEVGAAGEPAFENGWQDLAGDNQPVGFYKDAEGVVHLEGQATVSNPHFDMFQLPPGYRPPTGKWVREAAECNCQLTVGATNVPLTSGGIVIFGSGFGASGDGGVLLDANTEYPTSGFFVSLDGITFRAGS